MKKLVLFAGLLAINSFWAMNTLRNRKRPLVEQATCNVQTLEYPILYHAFNPYDLENPYIENNAREEVAKKEKFDKRKFGDLKREIDEVLDNYYARRINVIIPSYGTVAVRPGETVCFGLGVCYLLSFFMT